MLPHFWICLKAFLGKAGFQAMQMEQGRPESSEAVNRMREKLSMPV